VDTISFRLAPAQGGGFRGGSLSARLIMPAMNGPENKWTSKQDYQRSFVLMSKAGW